MHREDTLKMHSRQHHMQAISQWGSTHTQWSRCKCKSDAPIVLNNSFSFRTWNHEYFMVHFVETNIGMKFCDLNQVFGMV